MLYEEFRSVMKRKWGKAISRFRQTRNKREGTTTTNYWVPKTNTQETNDAISADFDLLWKSVCTCGGPRLGLHCLCHKKDLPVPAEFEWRVPTGIAEEVAV